jgi:PRTRC genetic system protein E
MTFFKSLEKLIAADMTVKIEVKNAGNGQLQVYIATAAKAGDSTQPIPPVGLKASAEELDAKVPEFMLTYADGALSLGEQFEKANAAVKEAEVAAKQQRESAAATRTAGKPATTAKGPTSSGRPSGSPKVRDASDGMLDLGADDESGPSGTEPSTEGVGDKALFI